jgi:uncharacterized protein (DUF302 family)
MITECHVKRYEHLSEKSFEALVGAFEAAVGDADDGRLTNGLRAVTGVEDWEGLCKSRFGSSGFMHVLTMDHGRWLGFYGKQAKARQYTYGNPLVAETMLKHDVRAGSEVPLRVMFYESRDGRGVMAYDLPSSLMRRYENPEIDAAARKLDEKVVSFAQELTGVEPRTVRVDQPCGVLPCRCRPKSPTTIKCRICFGRRSPRMAAWRDGAPCAASR